MKGRDTGMMDGPMYRVWMQESVPPSTCYLERPGRWVAEEIWPSPRIEARRLSLSADGRLGGVNLGKRSVCSPLWVGLAAGEVGRYGDEAEWPVDQREDDGGSLVWVSDPLPEPLEILGAPLIHLRFASDRPQALVAARLNDVFPDGRSTRVGIGLLNLTHRDSHEHATPLEPGRAYEATVEMDDIAHAFPAGHRIAVSLSTTYWPIAWPSPELATLTVHCGTSALELPIRPRRPEDEALPPFGPPEEAPDTPAILHPVESRFPRRVTRDLMSGRMTVDFPRWTSHRDLTDIGQTHVAEGMARYEITDGDPLSARCETFYKVEIRRPDATVTHESRGDLTCDATHFRIRMDVVLHEDGQEVFRRAWDERILRDMV
jgi:predicted acyl esterase